ncbi:MAG: arsenite methyltransferase [bacterium]|jgi:arsenite methyltransferase
MSATATEKREEVQEYYGKTLQNTNDLKTNACCTLDGIPKKLRSLISDIHEEVNNRYYGCGLIAPSLLEGMKILDLGSGSGRDAFILSKLVGETGEVVGIDMTDEQLAVANQYVDYHTELYGYKKPNVSFKKGYIEKLDELGLEDNYFDIVVSNCVINLSPDKDAVLREVYRVLKTGGEFYFSDVYSDRRIQEDLVNNEILYGECLSGALYYNDFRRIAQKADFNDVRKVESSPITVQNEEIEALVGNIQFESITYRLFKIPTLEDACEDYGQAVIYKGSIPDHPTAFDLDDHHHFEKGRSVLICSNTYLMLKKSRFSDHFEYFGDMSTHLGLFQDCASPSENVANTTESISGGSCC